MIVVLPLLGLVFIGLVYGLTGILGLTLTLGFTLILGLLKLDLLLTCGIE
tara:strand:+ start:579 stop:728 length:150 start_codon:yes stop_codon:yes gene_type:complete